MKEISTNREPSSKGEGSSVFIKCQNQALVYLGIREHNRKELSLKLKTKGFDDGTIKKTLDSLEDDGSLSEKRYVRSFVTSSNKRHPEGKLMLQRRLVAKGADRESSSTVLDELYTIEYTTALVVQAKASIERKGKAQTEEDIRFCLKKLGFSDRDIKLSD
jgi:SOS response regulatory protein OraA/RecX